jgi:hypothetical protein
MRMVQVGVAAAGFVAALAGATAITAAPSRSSQHVRAASTAPFLPLSESDLTSARETGCTCTFEARNRTLVQVIGNELMLRTRPGRRLCRITGAQFQALSSASGSASCAGLRMSLRPAGRTRSYPASDSVSGPAVLTARQGSTRHTLSGTWGCAC